MTTHPKPFDPDETAGAKVHRLKTWPQYFRDIWFHRKTFECRLNDRDFRIGDTLRLLEYRSDVGYSGRSIDVKVTYITELADMPVEVLRPGWVIMGIRVAS